MYVVPVVSSTMRWLCVVYSAYCITMYYYGVLSLFRNFVTTELVHLIQGTWCLSIINSRIDERIGTDSSGCAGCRWVERTVFVIEHTHVELDYRPIGPTLVVGCCFHTNSSPQSAIQCSPWSQDRLQ